MFTHANLNYFFLLAAMIGGIRIFSFFYFNL